MISILRVNLIITEFIELKLTTTLNMLLRVRLTNEVSIR